MTMMILYGALLVVGVTLLAVTVVRVLAGGITDSSADLSVAPSGSDRSARRILDERYAAGDLSTEDYQQRRRILEGDE
jgi:putative membrane protein